MKIPTELLGDYFDPVRAGRRRMKVERRPNLLTHHGQTDKNNRGDDGPENFEAVIPVRVNRACAAGGVAILPNHPAQSDLRGGESHTNHDDRDPELTVHARPVFRDGFGKPPAVADKHPDREQRYDPDGYSENASHRLSPS